MKNETSDYYTWDDVIFENRNRSYGAYMVRQSYSRNATIAFGASVSFAILLLFLPQIISALTGGEVIIPSVIPIGPKTQPMLPPPIIPDPPAIVPPPPAAIIDVPPANVPLQVVSKEIDTYIPPNSGLLTAPSSPEGVTGGYIESPSSGIVEVPVVAPPSGPLDIAEVMPAYDGGLQEMARFISKNIRYPRSASSMGIEGTVFVSFVINADGNVVDVKVVRGVSADCDKEAMRVISKMTEWSAGMMHHVPVAVRMVLPIKFQINQ